MALLIAVDAILHRVWTEPHHAWLDESGRQLLTHLVERLVLDRRGDDRKAYAAWITAHGRAHPNALPMLVTLRNARAAFDNWPNVDVPMLLLILRSPLTLGAMHTFAFDNVSDMPEAWCDAFLRQEVDELPMLGMDPAEEMPPQVRDALIAFLRAHAGARDV